MVTRTLTRQTRTTAQRKTAENNISTSLSYDKSSPGAPNLWGSLNEQFAQCEKGKEQSPIDIKGAVVKASALRFLLTMLRPLVGVENNGHTIVANMPHDQNHILIDGKKI